MAFGFIGAFRGFDHGEASPVSAVKPKVVFFAVSCGDGTTKAVDGVEGFAPYSVSVIPKCRPYIPKGVSLHAVARLKDGQKASVRVGT